MKDMGFLQQCHGFGTRHVTSKAKEFERAAELAYLARQVMGLVAKYDTPLHESQTFCAIYPRLSCRINQDPMLIAKAACCFVSLTKRRRSKSSAPRRHQAVKPPSTTRLEPVM